MCKRSNNNFIKYAAGHAFLCLPSHCLFFYIRLHESSSGSILFYGLSLSGLLPCNRTGWLAAVALLSLSLARSICAKWRHKTAARRHFLFSIIGAAHSFNIARNARGLKRIIYAAQESDKKVKTKNTALAARPRTGEWFSPRSEGKSGLRNLRARLPLWFHRPWREANLTEFQQDLTRKMLKNRAEVSMWKQ